jgi:hypothetical protein
VLINKGFSRRRIYPRLLLVVEVLVVGIWIAGRDITGIDGSYLLLGTLTSSSLSYSLNYDTSLLGSSSGFYLAGSGSSY